MRNNKDVIRLQDKDDAVSTEVSKDTFRSVFRLLFAGEDSMFGLYAGPIIIGKNDIEILNKGILEKLAHYEVQGITFTALASYENRRSKEYGAWDRFSTEDWSTPDVLDSLSLTWNFAICLPKSGKPSTHNINVRISSSIKPQHLIQAIFSKDPEDLEKIDLRMVPMSCRINVIDHILSEEFLDIVSRWHKALRSPEYIFPIMKKLKQHSDAIHWFIHKSIPALSTLACFGYYYNYAKDLDPNSTITTGVLTDTILWLVMSMAVVALSVVIGNGLSSYVQRQLHRFGSFTVFEITNGDKNRQTVLHAKSANSFWKFLASSILALLWNIFGGIITAFLLRN